MKFFLLSFFIISNIINVYAVEGGYMSRLSYSKGDTLQFHISSKLTTYTLVIYRFKDSPELIQTITAIPGGEYTLPDSSYYSGCGWPVSYSMPVPNNWTPGAYKAEFNTSVGKQTVIFFIRNRNPGLFSKILVVPSTNTWNAYNPYGGKSLYDYNSSSGIRSPKVSFLRPSTQFASFTEFRKEELLLIQWLYTQNIDVEFAVDYDLHNESDLLSHYKLVIISGHSEYWSYQMRVNCENFVKSGGNLLIMSGNTAWWQVRFEDDGNTLVCYKDRLTDPMNGVIDSLVTVNYFDAPLNNSENSFTGLSFLSGGFVNNNGVLTQAQGYGGYSVLNSHHWAFEGTGLKDVDIFGYEDAIVGNEVDGARFNYVNGIPVLTGTDNSPVNFRVLGSSPSSNSYGYNPSPHGFMGSFFVPGGGTVVNLSTIYWGNGFASNYYVNKITTNIINRLVNNDIPPDIFAWTPFTVKNKLIMNETVPINSRDILLKDDVQILFSVNAIDPFGHLLDFDWQVNNIDFGQSSSLLLDITEDMLLNKINKVTALVSADRRTSSISWNIINTELAITSDPVISVLQNDKYFLKFNVFNYYNDQLTYSLSGPSWLSISTTGELKGTASILGSFPVTVYVSNQHGQTDSLSYTITVNSVFPVEMVSFTADYKNNHYRLNWKTATELNNLGFDVEMKTAEQDWIKIGFVKGNGNSNTPNEYSFLYSAQQLNAKTFFRLKQIDTDGKFTYLKTVEANLPAMPARFELSQNYPNPFNPATMIRYNMPLEGNVSLIIFNSLGEVISAPVNNELKSPGYHEFTFNGENIASGVYYYTIKITPSDGSIPYFSARKMMLIK